MEPERIEASEGAVAGPQEAVSAACVSIGSRHCSRLIDEERAELGGYDKTADADNKNAPTPFLEQTGSAEVSA